MARSLYVTYTPDDLAEHASQSIQEARVQGWDVITGPRDFEFPGTDRLLAAEQADALLLLSACWYTNNNDDDEKPIHEREWDAAQKAGKPARALLVKRNPRPVWDLNQVEFSKWKELEAFHDKLVKAGQVQYFVAEPESVLEGTRKQLAALEADLKQRVTVFVVWDSTIPGLDSVAERSFTLCDGTEMFVKPMAQPLLRRSR